MTVSDSTLEIDRTQAAHLVAAEQNFQKGYTLHIDHERRHCQFRKRWGLGSLHCAYAHALDILDTLSERYPTSFKITGERHNGEVPRPKPPPTPKREASAITADAEVLPQPADEPSAEEPMNTHIADDTSAQEGVPTTPPPRTAPAPKAEPKESTVAQTITIDLTQASYTSSELAEETGISGRRICHLRHDDGVEYTSEDDGLHFKANTGLVQALYQRFGILATITLISEEPGEGEPIIESEDVGDETPSLDDEITMTLDETTTIEDVPPEAEWIDRFRPDLSKLEVPADRSNGIGTRSALHFPDVQAKAKRVLKDLVDAVIDGETILITQNGEHARLIEETLTNHGVELKRRGEELLDLASHSRSIRRSLTESHS